MWTKKAAGTLGASILSLTLGWTTGSGTLVAIGIITALALSTGLLLTRPAHISVTRAPIHTRHRENDELHIILTIHNRGRSTTFVEVADHPPALFRVREGSNHARNALRPGEECTHEYTLEMPVKGRYEFGQIDIRIQDAWGLRASTTQLEAPASTVVIPATQKLRKVPSRTRYPRIFLGAHLVRSPGQGMEFFGLRDYMPGDPLKEVNWKASARSPNLVVNQREKETVADVTIFLDARQPMAFGRADDNPNLWSARATATLSEFFAQRRDKVRLVIYGENIHTLDPTGGQNHQRHILDALTDLTPRGATPFATVAHRTIPRLRRKSPAIIITSLLDDPTLVEGCALLRGLGMHILVLAIQPRHQLNDLDTNQLVELDRKLTISDLRGVGAHVIEWDGESSLSQRLMEVAP